MKINQTNLDRSWNKLDKVSRTYVMDLELSENSSEIINNLVCMLSNVVDKETLNNMLEELCEVHELL